MDVCPEFLNAENEGGTRTVTINTNGSLTFENKMNPSGWYTVTNTENSCKSFGNYESIPLGPKDAEHKFSQNIMSIYADIPNKIK
jgi:hypothetical protein